jgi:hypothetical protein
MSSNELDKKVLFNLLKNFNDEARQKIILVAVGGTAMTLLDLKTSTMDIDFTISINDKAEFDRVRTVLPHGFKIDVYTDGDVFCNRLPNDYLERSVEITNFTKISLRALHPVDIVVTKIGRLNQRDIQDIESCIKRCKIKKEDIQKRAAEMIYVGREGDYEYHLQWIIQKFYSDNSKEERAKPNKRNDS